MKKIFAATLLLSILTSFASANDVKDKPNNKFIDKQITIEEQLNEMYRIQKKAYELLEYNLKIKREKEAIKIVLDYLKTEPFVTQADASGVGRGMPCIRIIFGNDMEGIVSYRKPGYK